MIIQKIIGIYFIYNLLIGVLFFSFKYNKTEQKVIDRKEFTLLILFPFFRYGNRLYDKDLRENGATKFHREWFISILRYSMKLVCIFSKI